MLKLAMRLTILLATFTVLLPFTARAADPAFCAGYTDAALNQVRAALSNPSCRGGAVGARWSPDRHVHFEWCRTQPPAAAERQVRTDFLRGCRG